MQIFLQYFLKSLASVFGVVGGLILSVLLLALINKIFKK